MHLGIVFCLQVWENNTNKLFVFSVFVSSPFHLHKELSAFRFYFLSLFSIFKHQTQQQHQHQEMTIMSSHQLAFIFGLLGNIVSFMVYLAPVPTFIRIYKMKSTQGFQSIPYSVALFSAMLTLFYGFLKTNGFMLISINSIGCSIEIVYLTMFMIYAPKPTKIQTAKLLILFNLGVYGLLTGAAFLFSDAKHRVTVIGWLCAVFSVSVFAAPLSIMRIVIRTKSVEYMPFPLSFSLTLCAIMWFCYGLLIKDFYIAVPNILGLSFGIAQMILYFVYRDTKKVLPEELKLPELPIRIVLNPESEETIMQEKANDNNATQENVNDNNATEMIIIVSSEDDVQMDEAGAIPTTVVTHSENNV